MDMWSTAGIRHRTDRAEAIAARRIGRGSAIPLEIIIERRTRAVVMDIMVSAVRVTLPDLDQGAGNRSSGTIDDAPADISGGALCDPFVSGDLDQVVIR